MTSPLMFVPVGLNAELRPMVAADFARFRYNLRVRYANSLVVNPMITTLPGSIRIGGGTSIGPPAFNTERTQVSNSRAAPPFPGASTGVDTVTTYNYGQIFTNLPVEPSADGSYIYFDEADNTLRPQANMTMIDELIITPCIDAMKNIGDEADGVGTYRVSAGSPGTGYTRAGPVGSFFEDTLYSSVVHREYSLWVKTSSNVPAIGALPLRGISEGLRQDSLAGNSVLGNFMYDLLVRKLNMNDGNGITYSVRASELQTGAADRGSFIDTQLGDTDLDNTEFSIDDYRSTATPEGSAVNLITYHLGLT